MREAFAARSRDVAQRYRAKLADWYGKAKADKVQYAEAFEISPLGYTHRARRRGRIRGERR